MTVLVFAGPSCPHDAIRAIFPEAVCLPPAGRGDVLRALAHEPAALCLIDGTFDTRPAVSHKELLWAIRTGVAVYGSSSMGALRAAELQGCGMVGRGRIYTWFAQGTLDRDDEVAVAHASSEQGYRVGSDALVNIRATLARAEAERVGSHAARAWLLDEARATFYADRSLPDLARRLARTHTDPASHELAAWLRDRRSYVDQKREDALQLLAEVRAASAAGTLARRPPALHAFPYTAEFHALRQSLADELRSERVHAAHVEAAGGLGGIVTELQLLGPEEFGRLMLAASQRALAQQGTVEPGVDPGRHAFLAAARELPGLLAVSGDLERVAGRARRKRERVSASGPAQPPDDAELLRWFFEQRLARPVPSDLAGYAATVGLGTDALLAAIRNEHAFVHGV